MKWPRLLVAGLLLSLTFAVSLWRSAPTVAQGAGKAPAYKVDPFWPKPLPSNKVPMACRTNE
jgi:hypothetical protein